jgi:hypothetical protein
VGGLEFELCVVCFLLTRRCKFDLCFLVLLAILDNYLRRVVGPRFLFLLALEKGSLFDELV